MKHVRHSSMPTLYENRPASSSNEVSSLRRSHTARPDLSPIPSCCNIFRYNCYGSLECLQSSVRLNLSCKPTANGRSKRRQIGRNELSLNGQNRRKGEVISAQKRGSEKLPKTEAYPLSSPPCYIHIPTQNFLVILEIGVA